jgi:glutaminase
MYDGAGEWFVGVGLPAKSGVSGGILAVLPGQLGIAVWSPPLDGHGDSVRGVAVCRDLSSAMDLHLFTAALSPTTPIRSHRTVATRWSKRVRHPDERLALMAEGASTHLVELQGDIGFAAVEAVLRAIDAPVAAERIVLDLARVTRLDPATAPLLADLAIGLDEHGGSGLAWSDGRVCAATLDAVDALLEAIGSPLPRRFAELDAAVEWCEEQVLARHAAVTIDSIPLARHPVLAGLPPEALAVLESVLLPRSWAAGEVVIRQGEPARELFLLTSGDLSVYVPLEGRERGRRLATLTAGMVFGETSFLAGGTRTADVVADTPVDAWILDIDTFRRIRATKPEIAATLLENLYGIVAAIAKRLTEEVAAIAA